MSEDFLDKRLAERKTQNSFRILKLPLNTIDFCSNDYLGIIKNDLLSKRVTPGLKQGSGGSRLLAGNYSLIADLEKSIADFHQAESALIFNSGYDANIGLLSCVPQKGDTVLYDKLSHASLRDGIRLAFAESFSFFHNDLADLENKLGSAKGNVFVVTESVFSMDGDMAPLVEIGRLCEKYNAHFIVDEAHATGIIGETGEGLVQLLKIPEKCFARVHTFGKACGAHGAVILGSGKLKNYLINFARSFIYTTALPEISISAIRASYEIFPFLHNERAHLQALIHRFNSSNLNHKPSHTPIRVVAVPGNKEAREMAEILQDNNFDVRAILYPTVPKGTERLRIILHAFNSSDELHGLLNLLSSLQ